MNICVTASALVAALVATATAAEVDFTQRLVDQPAPAAPADSGPDAPLGLFAADLDGDGDLDLVSTALRNDRIAWHENDGAAPPTFAAHEIAVDPDGPCGEAQGLIDTPGRVSGGDLDGDGDVDIAVTGLVSDLVAWLENDGGAAPSFTYHVLSDTADAATDVTVVDVDGDDDLDVVAALQSDPAVIWFDNTGGSPPVFVRRDVASSIRAAGSITTADVNGDGDLDLLAHSVIPGDHRIGWYENSGGPAPSFTMHAVVVVDPSGVVGGDLDGDGDTDLVTTGLSGSAATLIWHENDGGTEPSFAERPIAVARPAVGPKLRDLDGDGDRDIVTASSLGGDSQLRWFDQQDDPPASFVERVIGLGATCVLTADLDGDGDQDVAACHAVADLILWYDHLGATCPGDTNGSGGVDFDDLLELLSHWGPCP